jgi:hypothetical protein
MSSPATSVGNAAMLEGLALDGFTIVDGLDAGGFTTTASHTTQALATPVSSPVARFVTAKSAGTGTTILKSLLTGEAQYMIFIINDSPFTIIIYPASGEYLNTVQNGTLSLATGQTAVGLVGWHVAAVA